jgi:RecB family exonuclease
MQLPAGQLELDFVPEPSTIRLRLVRAASNQALWDTCADRFLSEVGEHVGPADYPAAIWLAHRTQRDALYERAAANGLSGWLSPPVYFLSELPGLFDIPGRPIGLFTRRRMISRLASEVGRELGIGASDTAAFRGHMLDGLFSELLPEGVTPARLAKALAQVATDSFSERRNAWIERVYAAYLETLRDRALYDPRSIHALIADRVGEDGLKSALPGIARLHIYGIISLRTRRRLFSALATQPDAEVHVYLPFEEEVDEWATLGAATEEVGDRAVLLAERVESVQPAPDAQREFQWVARQIKEVLIAGEAEPHEVAVVARSGREDTRRAFRALHAAGIPCSARVRTPLAEIAALKALLELFRAASSGWAYRPLRNVLASRYFQTGIDVRWVDEVAARCRVEGLDAWQRQLERLLHEAGGGGHRTRRKAEWLRDQTVALAEFRALAADFGNPRVEREWVDLTYRIAGGQLLAFRARICRPIENRWDVVRLDQRGVKKLEALLLEWSADADDGRPMSAREWYGTLRRLLDTTELALSTPMQKGVQILEAHEAALTPFRSTFIVHANDGVFPKSSTAGGVLSDDERVILREAGVPVTEREEALRRERTLWRSVAAVPRVVMTYRTTDPNGTPLLPSLLVPTHDPANELPRSRVAAAVPVSGAEARRHSATRLRQELRRPDSAGAIVTAGDSDRLRHAVLTSTAERLRTGHPELGADAPPLPNAWNGLLRDPVVLRDIQWRFGDDYQWSPGTLEKYAKCPFFFFVGKVLKISEVEEASEETDVATFGSIAHEVLERFYRRHGQTLPSRLDDETKASYETIVREVLDEWESGDRWLGLPALWSQTREGVREAVRDFLAWELKLLHRDDQKPRWLEYGFGYGNDRVVTIEGEDLAGVRRAMRLTGRIDRVDEVAGGERHHIIDYKSGGAPPAKGYDDGSVLQTPLYMRAVSSAEGVNVVSGGYRSIRRRQAQSVLRWGDARFERALRIAFSIPERVHRGLFEAVHSAATSWERWEPGRDVCRTDARYRSGSRFDD